MEELSDIGERIHTQDNMCTAEPMFCLQVKVRDIGYDPAYSDDTMWVNMRSGDYERAQPHDPGAEKVGYRDRWETVMTAFTRQGIENYMKLNGHNVCRRAHNGETRIYVDSFKRCEEMILIRRALMEAARPRGR